MVAALLTEDPVHTQNVSQIVDAWLVSELLELLGCSTAQPADGELRIHARDIHTAATRDLEYFHVRSRIPVLTCALLLHRTGQAEVWKPGGCSIGERPVDLHLEVLRAFGAVSERTDTGFTLSAEVGGLKGTVVELKYPSVGATEQFLLGAVVAAGDSELRNAATEPEIIDLISMLQRMGALITVQPGRLIQVTGVSRLRGVSHTAIPDRLEAASWASLALATDGRITVRGVRQVDLGTYLNVYRRAGGELDFSSDGNEVTFRREKSMPRPLVIETDAHPGFMTDWQSPMVTALTQADGVTVLHETVHENRLAYGKALQALGAQMQVRHLPHHARETGTAVAARLIAGSASGGGDLEGDGHGNLRMQSHGHLVDAGGLDMAPEVHHPLVQRWATRRPDRVDDVGGGDRAEKLSAGAGGLGRHGNSAQTRECTGDLPSVVEVADLPGLLGSTNRRHLLLRALGGRDGQPAREQVIACVAVLDLYEVAGRAQLGNVSSEDDLHLVASSRYQRAVEV
jgi:UDP-N-acetylglucosamine 1-carboxyvinyltransferase